MLYGAYKAGFQSSTRFHRKWVPAFARMTKSYRVVRNNDSKPFIYFDSTNLSSRIQCSVIPPVKSGIGNL